MNCQQIRELIPAHHDSELDAANTLQVEQHIADCPQCFSVLKNLDSMSSVLREGALRYSAPVDLRRLIRADAMQASRTTQTPDRTARAWWRLGLAAAAALAVFFLGLELGPSRSEDRLLTELTAGHVRSMMASHLMDVASSDRHTVKPWFDGKIDFAPPVKDLRDSGFPLIGGRLDYVQSRAVAALVYSRQKHLINLFIWPAGNGDSAPKAREQNGYHLIQWTSHGMTFWAVSDLNEKELMDFAVLSAGS